MGTNTLAQPLLEVRDTNGYEAFSWVEEVWINT